MRVGTIRRCGLVAAVLLMVSAQAGEAQISKLKKAAQQAANAAAAPVAPAAPAAARPDSNVIAITDAVLDALVLGIETEEELRQLELQRAAIMAADQQKYEAWESCVEQNRASFEQQAQGLASRAQAAQARGDLKTVMAIADSIGVLQTKAAASEVSTCGYAPPRDTFAQRSSALVQPRDDAFQALGLTNMKYAVVKERLLPFCTLVARGGADASTQQIPGDAIGHSYIYSSAEAAVITPRCAALLPLLTS